MRLKIYFSFHIKEGSVNQIREFFIKSGRKDLAKKITDYPTFNILALYINDPLIPKSKKELKKYIEDWSDRTDYEFNENELQSCKLLTFSGTRYPKAYAGPETGTQYDLSDACKGCGSGAIQIGPLLIRPSDLKKLDVQNTVPRHIIISKKLRDAFLKEKIKGVEFREVASKTNKKVLGFYQVIPDHTLPPALPSSFEKENSCPVCKRDGYFNGHIKGEPYIMKYKINPSILKKSDMFHTYEIYGNSVLREPFEESVFNQPIIVVSPKVSRILSNLKIKEAGFFPVVVNDLPDIEKWKEVLNNDSN